MIRLLPIRSAERARAILGAAGLALIPSPAFADSSCGPEFAMNKLLVEVHKEVPVLLGVTDSSGLMRLYTNPTSRMWTIALSRPDGVTCFILSGYGLEFGHLAEPIASRATKPAPRRIAASPALPSPYLALSSPPWQP